MPSTTGKTVAHPACESMFVKWETPEEELASTARLAEAFVHRHIDEANDLAIAVPNMAWAVQARRAAAVAGLPASIRAPRAHLSAATKSRLSLLEVLANPEDERLRRRWAAAGRPAEELDELVARYGSSRASALIRLCDLPACPELEHGLLHVCGDEDAQRLLSIIDEQLERPTSPEGLQVASVVLLSNLTQAYAQLFVVGCVEGLLDAADEATRRAFLGAAGHATKRLYYSGFAKADLALAKSAHLAYVRTRREGERELALCRVSPLFADFGAARPSTLGGQVLLRTYQLN